MQLHHIAAHFRVWDVSELLGPEREPQLHFWLAYFDLCPMLSDQLNVLLPKLFADLLNMWRDPEASPEPITCSDLQIDWQQDPPDPAAEPEITYTETVKQSELTMAATILAAFGH
jgi:hypothetical protein